MPITEISGGYRQRINVQDMNIGPGGRLIHDGLVARSDVQAMLDHAKANDPDYAAARNKYEFRLVRSGEAVFLDMKKRNWAGRLKARLHIGNEQRANERKAAVTALNRAMGMRAGTFDDFKANAGAATNRRAAAAYQVALTNRAETLELEGVQSLRRASPVRFYDGETLPGTLSSAVDAVMQNRSVAQAAKLLRDNPGFAIQLFHQANVNRTRPEFAEVVGRIADLYDEYMKAPDLAAAEAFSVYDWINLEDGPRSDLRQRDLDGYYFPTTGGLVARMLPATVDDVILPQGARPLQEGLVAFSIDDGGQVRSLVDGDEQFDARAIYAAEPVFLGRALRKLESAPCEKVAECLLKDAPEPLRTRFNDVLRGSNEPMDEATQFGPVLAAVENASRTPGLVLAVNRWGAEARLSDAHLAELREIMTRSGIPDTPQNFAKYLFSLSALFTKISGAHGFGSEQQSVIPLRFYGFMLMKASEEADPSVLLPQEIYGYIGEMNFRVSGYQDIFTADRCADVLGSQLSGTAVSIDREIFRKVASPYFADQFGRLPGGGRPLAQRLAPAAANAPGNVAGNFVQVPGEENRDIGVALLNRMSEAGSDDDESIEDIDDMMSERQNDLRDFIMNQIRDIDDQRPGRQNFLANFIMNQMRDIDDDAASDDEA